MNSRFSTNLVPKVKEGISLVIMENPLNPTKSVTIGKDPSVLTLMEEGSKRCDGEEKPVQAEK